MYANPPNVLDLFKKVSSQTYHKTQLAQIIALTKQWLLPCCPINEVAIQLRLKVSCWNNESS